MAVFPVNSIRTGTSPSSAAIRQAQLSAASVLNAARIAHSGTLSRNSDNAVQSAITTQRHFQRIRNATVSIHFLDKFWYFPVSVEDPLVCDGQVKRISCRCVNYSAVGSVQLYALDPPQPGISPAQVVVVEVQG